MEHTTNHDLRTFRLHIDDHGRFVIPADSKIRQACRAGERLIAVENENGELSIRRYAHVVRDVQQYFKNRVPEGRDLIEELITERRAEAASE